jgi:hypothetical protein
VESELRFGFVYGMRKSCFLITLETEYVALEEDEVDDWFDLIKLGEWTPLGKVRSNV